MFRFNPRRRLRAGVAVALIAGGLPLLVADLAPALGPGSPPLKFGYLRSTDGGRDFTPYQLADVTAQAEQVHVEARGDFVNAVYDDLEPQPRRLFHRHSDDEGETFAPSQRLDKPQSGAAVEVGDSGEADLVDDGEVVHVAWEDDRFLTADYTVPSFTAGTNVIQGIRLRNDVTFSNGQFWPEELPGGDPDNDADNNIIPSGTVIPAGSLDPSTDSAFFKAGEKRVRRADRIVNRDEIYYAASTDNGATFPVGRNLTDSADVHDRDPDPDAEGSTVLIAHEGEDLVGDTTAKTDLFVLRSTDGGATFVDTNVTPGVEGEQDEPSVALEGTDATVVFRHRPDDPLDSDEVLNGAAAFVHSSDGGATFSGMAELPSTRPATAEHGTPHVFASGASVLAASCENNDPNPDLDGDETFKLLLWTSTDGGATFPNQPAVLDSGAESCARPHIDGADSDRHLVYEKDVFGVSEVFTVKSTNGGATWTAPRNLSVDQNGGSDPVVSVNPDDSGDVHVAWVNETDFLFSLKYGQDLPLEEGDERSFANEDVIRSTGGAYEMVLDGSDVGLRNFRIDGLAKLGEMEFLLSFSDSGTVPGIGTADDSDIVLFTATSLGETTSGTFSRYFDGSDVGLSSSSEDVDAIEVRNGQLFLSTYGSFSASGASGADEDLFVCDGFVPGPDTSCSSVSVVLDGSAIGLGSSGEDIDGFAFDTVDPTPFLDGDEWVAEETKALFSFYDDWSVPTASGDKTDLAQCVFPEVVTIDPVQPTPFGLPDCGGPNVPLRKVWTGEAHLIDENINAIELDF